MSLAARALNAFLAFVVDELSAEARHGHAGHSFETLGRVEPLLPHDDGGEPPDRRRSWNTADPS